MLSFSNKYILFITLVVLADLSHASRDLVYGCESELQPDSSEQGAYACHNYSFRKTEIPSDANLIKYYHNDGKLEAAVSYKNRVLHGPFRTYHLSGNIESEVEYINGKKEGLLRYYYENGEIESEGLFKNGIAQGNFIDYHKNRNKRRVIPHNKNGEIDGIDIEYNEAGIVIKETPYVNGKIQGTAKEYYDSGKLKREGTFVNNKEHGPGTWYYESGAIEEQFNYKNDELDGKYITYYETGELASEMTLKKGKREGIETRYCIDGKVGGKGKYHENKLVGYFECVSGKRGLETIQCPCDF